MKWLTVAVKADFGWPVDETEIEYLGCKYLLRPENDVDAQSVSLLCPVGATMDSARLLVNRFLSALSWAEGHGINELFAVGSNGPSPMKVSKSKARFISKKFVVDYLPEPKDEKSLRALALYREAQSLNSPAYSFLGFFKILNILFGKGPDQKNWVNNNLASIKGCQASERLAVLRKQYTDIGEYLYVQGRCAVAHAFNDSVVNPDIPADIQRLSDDLPVIEELSEIAIERELGVISKSTFRAMHLYELAGFETLLGPDIVTLLKEGKPLDKGTELDIPPLSLRLRDHANFTSYEDLQPVSFEQCENSLLIRLHSSDNILQLIILLDFKQWRLGFDPLENVIILDDSSARPMLVNSDTALFTKGACLNGQIEIYNTKTNELLARTDPVIPHNVDLRTTVTNLDRISAQSLEEAQRRAVANAKPAVHPE